MKPAITEESDLRAVDVQPDGGAVAGAHQVMPVAIGQRGGSMDFCRNSPCPDSSISDRRDWSESNRSSYWLPLLAEAII